MKFDVKNRYTGRVQFTAEIECPLDAVPSLKLGFAVRWGFATGANLAGANLTGADLTRTNLAGANLAGANLAGANLTRTNLVGANLAGANLTWAYLAWANLTGADLTGANLAGADLDGASLARADLDGASLARAKIRDHTIGKLIARAGRMDGYEFLIFATDLGNIIRAGCRTFTMDEFRAHVAAEYPGTDKARETLDILAFFEARLVGQGGQP